MNSNTMPRKKAITKKELDAIERAAKREAQKAAGALDGRFREKVVPNKKRKAQRRKKKVDPGEE
ncbi:MAG: hypothetical protein KF703_03280 [Actinobacteria bacterium]|nr:hypothetical protein [Actinomycetota bacterium]